MKNAIKVAMGGLLISVALLAPIDVEAQSREPIKIGFSMAMTGGLAANGKSALLAQKI
jgi:hypothetical protein